MNYQNIPTFKTEDSLWQMLTDGSKTWDARKWDLHDERIQRLTTPGRPGFAKASERRPPFAPFVAFQNKASGQVAVFAYRGYKAKSIQEWAPGWCFLLLGERVR